MSLLQYIYYFQRLTLNSVWKPQSQSCVVYFVSSTACHLVLVHVVQELQSLQATVAE